MLQAQNTAEETQRMTAVRKAYQKAIITPTHHIEQLWRDYENFENSVSRALVIFAYEYSSCYMKVVKFWAVNIVKHYYNQNKF